MELILVMLWSLLVLGLGNDDCDGPSNLHPKGAILHLVPRIVAATPKSTWNMILKICTLMNGTDAVVRWCWEIAQLVPEMRGMQFQ